MSEQILQFDPATKEVPLAVDAKARLLDLIEKEYFKNFLDQLDVLEKTVDVEDVEAVLGIDIGRMREYIDEKIPDLLEKIQAIVLRKNIKVIEHNSMVDVLGNSIIGVFKKIVWVTNNFNSDDPKIRESIENNDSVTRKIISLYSEDLATYYINTLCADDEKLEMEISTSKGFLAKYEEYFNDITMDNKTSKYYPSGGKKLAYFKFFSELEQGKINTGNLDAALSELDVKIVNVEKIKQSPLIQKK